MTAPESPPSMTDAPTAPDRSDRDTFSPRATAWADFQKATLVPQIRAAIANAYTNAVSAFESATASAASAASALASQLASAASASASAASAGATAWVSGTTYAIGDRRWSLVNQRVYARLTVGAGTTDPSADATNWRFVAGQRPVYRQVTGTTSTAAVGEWLGLANVAATTITAPPSPAVGDEFWTSPENGLTTNKIARNGQLIMGIAEDLNIGNASETVKLIFVGGATGWRLLDV